MGDHRQFGAREQDPAASRRTALSALRAALFILTIAVTMLGILNVGPNASRGEGGERLVTGWGWALAFAIVLASAVIAIDLLTPKKKISTLSGVFLGLIAGLAATIGTGFLMDLLAQGYGVEDSPIITTIKVLFGVAFCYLGVSIVLQTQDEFRLVIPYVEFSKQMRGPRPLLLDTSALIDARFTEVGETGLIQAPVVIPGFVIAELQALADSQDRLKRGKGRRGLDVVTRLQRSGRLDVVIDDSTVPGKSVDQMLVEMARRDQAIVVTCDLALARVCAIQQVSVVNLHDVANAMRTSVLAGETITLRIVREGEQPGQGVGFLDDGTMVVAENGGQHVGETRALVVTGALQTSAGRLVFARIPEPGLASGGSGGAGGDEPDAPAAPGDIGDEGPAAAERSGPPEAPRPESGRGGRASRRGAFGRNPRRG